MKTGKFALVLLLGLLSSTVCHGETVKKKILVVSSYHKGYLWSQETNKGFCDAMLKFGYFDNNKQINEYKTNDYAESSTVIIKKMWMDTKRKSSKAEIEETSLKLFKFAGDFEPDLIFLGDDNAARYLGRKFLDTSIPMVFWGLNNTPVKYNLIDSIEAPGHNVTGVYQSGYYIESLELLQAIIPSIKTFAVLSDTTPTGRSHYKEIERLAHKGLLPVTLIDIVSTNDFDQWKMKALDLQEKVDAFFLVQFSNIKTKNGEPVSDEEIVDWYIKHITRPEATPGHRVKLGLLCGADDSGYKQGFEAVTMAHNILSGIAVPATYPPRTPSRGPLMANKQRAKTLGITITPEMGIEQFVP